MRFVAAFFLAISSMWIACQPAFAAKRIALVIGNSAYQNVAPLANPSNDASAMSNMLKNAGFDTVDFRRDIKATDMRRALRDFSDKAREADMAIIYFAGHGVEIDGINYLVPVDAVLERSMDAYDEAISLDRMLDVITPARQLRLVILDACRDNPFSKTMKRTATRAIERGLAKVEPVSPNTLIAYAAKAGSTAADGDDKNSPFTTALVKYLPRPGLDLRKAFGFVRDDVLKTTGNRQEPFIYGSLGGEDVSLVPAASVISPARPVDLNAEARRDYELALQINVVSAWDAFISKYPSGFYTDLAAAQREKLRAGQVDAAAPAIDSPRLDSRGNPVAHFSAANEGAKSAAAAKATQEREAVDRQKAAVAAAAKAEQEREAFRLAEVARIKAAQEREALEKQKAAEAAAAAKSIEEREAARVAEVARVKAAQEREALERQKAAEAAAAAKAAQEREAALERQKVAEAAKAAKAAQESEAFEKQRATEAAAAAKAAQQRKAALERQKVAEAVRAADAARAAEAARAKAAPQAKPDNLIVAAIDPKNAGDIRNGPLPSQGCLGTSSVATIASRVVRNLSPAEECGLKPGDVFKECANCPEMVMVPAGEVVMGSNRTEIDSGLAAANEGPQHRAIVNQPIAVGRFEVTRDQYAAFVNSSGYRSDEHCFTFEKNVPQLRENRSYLNPGFDQTGNHPAVCVSWANAKAYAEWLSQTTGKQYRLLSEAEYEYVARAGGNLRFGFSNDADEICKFANGADQSAKAAGLPAEAAYIGCTDAYAFTAPVGSFAANAFGLFDLIGNVWEWTEDCFYGDYATAKADSAARTEAGCTGRTVRGGDWFSTEGSLRPAARAKANFDARHDDIGFRVMRVLDRF